MSKLPEFDTKRQLFTIVSDHKGDRYVTSWIEELEEEATLFVQRDLEQN